MVGGDGIGEGSLTVSCGVLVDAGIAGELEDELDEGEVAFPGSPLELCEVFVYRLDGELVEVGCEEDIEVLRG